MATATTLLLMATANAQWTVVNLHPAGKLDSVGLGGGGGKQVGQTSTSPFGAALWLGTGTSYVNLHPAGASSSLAIATDGVKQVGTANISSVNHASLWSGTAASWVDLAPPGATESHALGISGNQQVGWAILPGGEKAVLWSGTAASWVDLSPPGKIGCRAYGIHDGVQVGQVAFGGQYHASLWSGSAASWVDLHPGGTHSFALGVHNGQQVGYVQMGITRASLWTGTALSWVDLTPTGSNASRATAVYGGQQVGWAAVGDLNHAGIWKGTSASWHDLHQYLPAQYVNSEATGIWHDASGTYVTGTAWTGAPTRSVAVMWVGPPPPVDFALTLNKASVAGQNSVQGTITVAQAQPSNTVFTTYDNSSLVTTPANVTVLAGQLLRNFQITTTAITSTIVTTIFAKRGSVTRSQNLTLTPLIPTALAFTPSQVTGGQSTSCRVVINGVAGPGGRVLAIFDNSSFSTTPSTATVPAGATQVIFPITTTAVTSTQTVTVTARVSAGEKTGTFRINP